MLPCASGNGLAVLTASSTGNHLDSEATFFLGKGDYVLAVGDVEANAYNYVLVLAKDSGINNQIKVAMPDGTVSTYTLTASGTNVTFSAVEVGEVYSYTLSSSGNIRLNAPVRQAENMEDTGVSFTKGRTTIQVDDATYYATSSTVFFYLNDTTTPAATGLSIDSDEVDVYAGYGSAPTLSTSATKYASVYTRSNDSSSSSYDTAAVVVFRGTGIASANVDDFLYVYSKGNTGTDYTTVDAFVAGSSEAASVQVDGSYTASEGVHTWTLNSDGYYELDDPAAYSGSTGNLITGTFTDGESDWTVRSANSNTFVITNGTDTYELEIDAETMLVNDSSYLDDPTAELGAGPDEGDNIAYVLFSLDNGAPDAAKLVVIKNSTSDSSSGGGNTGPSTSFDSFATLDEINTALQSGNVTITGNWESTGRLEVPSERTLTIQGNYTGNTGGDRIQGTLNVTGDFTSNNATVVGTINVTGSTTLVDDTTISGSLTTGTLENTGSSGITVTGSLTVSGTNSLTQAISSSGTLSLPTVGGALTVTGGSATVTGAVTGAAEVSGGTLEAGSLSSTLTVTGGSAAVTGTVGGNVSVSAGSATIEGAITGDVEISGTGSAAVLSASGNKTANGTGTLTYGASGTDMDALNLAGTGNFVLAGTANGAITVSNAAKVTFNGSVSGTITTSAAAALTFKAAINPTSTVLSSIADGTTVTFEAEPSAGGAASGAGAYVIKTDGGTNVTTTAGDLTGKTFTYQAGGGEGYTANSGTAAWFCDTTV